MVLDNEFLALIRTIIASINLFIIILVSYIITYTTSLAIDNAEVWSLVENMKQIPPPLWQTTFIPFFAFSVLLYIVWRHRAMTKNSSFFLYGVAEVVLCLIIMYGLNFISNCVILLVIVDMTTYYENIKERLAFIVALFSIYILTSIGIMGEELQTIPLSTYLNYYNRETRSLLTGAESALTFLCLFLFMFYLVLIIRVQLVENERIRKLNEQLDLANEQLKRYARSSEKMAETRERNRLAREIHDTLGHTLTGIIAGLGACDTLLDYSKDAAKKQINLVTDVAMQGMKDVRRSVSALRPDTLERMDLENAILHIISEMEATTNAKIVFENTAGSLKFQEDEEETIYRIVQESITNSIRHGLATHIIISVKRVNGTLEIVIKDNGIGCKNIKNGFGLRHMKERIELLNGELRYDGDNGFKVIAHIPIRWGE